MPALLVVQLVCSDCALLNALTACSPCLFYAGYLMTQVVGGSLSDRIGGKPVMTISLWCTCVCTLLLPVASHFGTTALWLVLFAEGALQVSTPRWSVRVCVCVCVCARARTRLQDMLMFDVWCSCQNVFVVSNSARVVVFASCSLHAPHTCPLPPPPPPPTPPPPPFIAAERGQRFLPMPSSLASGYLQRSVHGQTR